MKTKIFATLTAVYTLFFMANAAYALTANAGYTITVEAIRSNGALTSTTSSNSLNLSTSGTTDTNGKLVFNLSGLPTSATYNFLVVTITNTDGVVARRSLMPAPDAGATLTLGVSPVTNAQTDAMISAFATAGTDDPILALFGYLLVRSPDISAADLSTMATFCYKGIKGTDGTGLTDGFEAYLRSSSRATPATTAMMASFRQNIVTNLASYASLYKDAVDEYFSTGASSEVSKRGEAAARLLNYLINAADTAGIDPDDVIIAMNEMGKIVVPLMNTAVADGTITAATAKTIDSTITRGMEKLRADKFLKKYTNALTILGASAAEIARYNAAATTLLNTMITNFQNFESSVNGDDMPTQDAINNFNTTMQQAMETAFTTFMNSIAATDAEIDDLQSRLVTATGVDASNFPDNMFQFRDQTGTAKNWPIMMVVTSRWLTTVIANGGSVSYTRDTTAIPTNMSGWFAARTNFTQGITDTEQLMFAALQGLREDVQIIEFTRYASFSGFSSDPATMMTQMQTAEQNFYTALDGLKTNITGTTNGTTAISTAQKDALVTLFQSPDF